MFFSVDILCRRDSKYAVAWLAATNGKKLKRRDYESVDVAKTCTDLMKHLPHAGAGAGHRRQPPKQSKKTPLFSLYLASQLMYGTVLIYDKQHKYLLDDLKQIIDNIKRLLTVGASIDLENPIGRDIDMRDPILDFDPLQMPEFGRQQYNAMKSPAVMHFGDNDGFIRVQTPRSGQQSEQFLHVARADEITLVEDDWRISPLLDRGFEGEEFPNAEDFQTDVGEGGSQGSQRVINIFLGDIMAPPESPIMTHDQKPYEPMPMDDGIAPAQPTEETPFVAPDDEPQFAPPLPPRRAAPAEPDVTFPQRQPRPRVPKRPVPVFELDPIDDQNPFDYQQTPRRRGAVRRLQLVIDQQHVLTGEQMKRQIEDMESNMQPSVKLVTPRENWMERQGLPLGAGIAGLFTSNLKSRRQEGTFADIFDEQPWTIPEDREHSHISYNELQQPQQQQMEYEPIMEEPQMDAIGMEPEGSTEAQREEDRLFPFRDSLGHPILESGAETVTPVNLLDNLTDEQQPIEEMPIEGPVAKRPRIRSPPPVDHLAKCYPPLPDMPDSTPHAFSLQRDIFEQQIYQLTLNGATATFEQLCPLTKTKVEAAKTFYMLLEMRRERKIKTKQTEPFGEITIQRAGSNSSESGPTGSFEVWSPNSSML